MIAHDARKLQERLNNIHQWSEISTGYRDVEALFESCLLDAKGKVTTAAMVTDLTG